MTTEGRSAAGDDDWTALVEQTLRGRDPAELSSTTRDGIEVQPLYTNGPERPAAMGAVAAPGRAERGWDIRTCHRLDANPHANDGAADSGGGAGCGGAGSGGAADSGGGAGARSSDLDALRQRIDDDLASGATSLELETGQGETVEELAIVLAGVDLAKTPVAFVPHGSLGTAAALGALAFRRGGPLAAGSSLGLDPLGEWARSGRRVEIAPAAEWAGSGASSPVGGGDSPAGFAGSIIDEAGQGAGDGFGAGVGHGAGQGAGVGHGAGQGAGVGHGAGQGAGVGFGVGQGVRVFMVDAVRYADAGATEAQALGWATATGLAYLRALVDAGLGVDAAAGLIGFRLAATADQFMTIAALRAARVMWSRVVTAAGGSEDAARQYQHAVTATHMYSRRDPWVNLLRGATAALAAGVAGADAVTVLPFDHVSGVVDAGGALGRRLARNTQLLLLEESHLARAADPAGGSFYVESLTDQLASAGWGVLQDVEASGGIEAAIDDGAIAAAIDDGAIAAAIDENWQSRLHSFARIFKT